VNRVAGRLNPVRKVGLGIRIWLSFLRILVALRRRPLPQVVARLRPAEARGRPTMEPVRLGRAVERVLRVGPWKARCLHTSLVLHHLLLEQGDRPQLVIGLPREPKDKDAHAWIELRGRDIGPPPGRSDHQELARYG
jgi:hypothetical protein